MAEDGSKKQKYQLKKLKISEVSMVPRGANQLADVAIFKAFVPENGVKNTVKKTAEEKKKMSENLHKLELLAESNDEEKAFIKCLTDEEQTDLFEKMEGEDMKAKMKRLRSMMDKAMSDPKMMDKMEKMLYKMMGGKKKMMDDGKMKKSDDVITKADLDAAVQDIEKRADARVEKAEAIATAASVKLEKRDLEARAEGIWPNIAGEVGLKGKLLKSINDLDEDVKEYALGVMKGYDDNLQECFVEKGHSVKKNGGSAGEELEKLATAYSEKNNVNFAKAYTNVLETPEGQKLYAETIK